MRTFLIATAILAVAAEPIVAQFGRTTVIIGAGDATSGQFLRGVQIRIGSLALVQYTDSMGQARLPRIPRGTYTIDARRIGYEPLSAPILVRGEDSVEVVLLMHAAVAQLDTVIVSRTAVPMALREFERRRERGIGQFITAAQIDSAFGSSLGTVLESHIRGVNVVGDNATGMHLVSYRQSTEHALTSVAGLCLPTVYLDGVQLVDDTGRGPNLDLIALSSIGGIEYYSPSEVPVQYKSSGVMASPHRTGVGAPGSGEGSVATSPSCGVMLIWTRP
jgi:hypothetical protein